MSEVQEGDVLAGKFRIERILGQGGMGVVVAATHIQLDERVALKFLLPEALSNAEAVARFAREARAAVKIKSEHVARVSDVGTLDSGSPYMVMEYLQGQDLSDWVRDRGAMPVADAVEFVLQACEALAEAHVLGIVHRDLKPANLFVTMRADGTPCIKVLDFGISKFTAPGSSSDMGMTKTAAVMGSPLYMSPEQMSSTRDVDARTDIWAIGVILYEIISGHVPFEAETMPQLCGMILQEAPPSLRSLRPDVPVGLEAVVLRCLAKDRAARFASVAELAVALAPFGPPSAGRSAERIQRVLRASGSLNLAHGLAQAAVPTSTGHDLALAATHSPARARAKSPLYFVVPLLVVILGGGVFFSIPRAPVAAERPPEGVSLAVPSAAAAAVVPASPPSLAVQLPQPPLQPPPVAPELAPSAPVAIAQSAQPVRPVANKRPAAAAKSVAVPKPVAVESKAAAAAAPPPTPPPPPVDNPLDGRR
jgi:eukaryotic-like serine/threonine-protein kinase